MCNNDSLFFKNVANGDACEDDIERVIALKRSR